MASIALDRDGSSVWVFERCGANDCVASPQVAPILKFDASGQLVKSFGAGMFIRPHAGANTWRQQGALTNVVSRIFASWNQLDGWLRQVDRLWRAA